MKSKSLLTRWVRRGLRGVAIVLVTFYAIGPLLILTTLPSSNAPNQVYLYSGSTQVLKPTCPSSPSLGNVTYHLAPLRHTGPIKATAVGVPLNDGSYLIEISSLLSLGGADDQNYNVLSLSLSCAGFVPYFQIDCAGPWPHAQYGLPTRKWISACLENQIIPTMPPACWSAARRGYYEYDFYDNRPNLVNFPGNLIVYSQYPFRSNVLFTQIGYLYIGTAPRNGWVSLSGQDGLVFHDFDIDSQELAADIVNCANHYMTFLEPLGEW